MSARGRRHDDAARDLLARALRLHGGTHAQFAAEVLGASRRGLQHWLAGDRPIPAPIVLLARHYIERHAPEKHATEKCDPLTRSLRP